MYAQLPGRKKDEGFLEMQPTRTIFRWWTISALFPHSFTSIKALPVHSLHRLFLGSLVCSFSLKSVEEGRREKGLAAKNIH